MKKAIVTGANGFIGKALCQELNAQGVEVIAVVKDGNSICSELKDLSGISFIECDMSSYSSLYTMIDDRDVDVVYHLAWVGSAGPLRGDADVQLLNIKNSCDLIKSCKDICCKRFVLASSIMEYEIAAVVKENMSANINSLYSTAKLSADYMLRALANSYDIEFISAVISNIYGPGEISPRLINTSIRKLLKGEHCSFSSGNQKYDFIYITDAAKAFYAVGDRGINNKTYYIGSMKPRMLKEFLLEMGEQVASISQIGLGEIPFTGVSLNYDEFDILALKNDTGFIPQIDFSTGIKNTTEWLKGLYD